MKKLEVIIKSEKLEKVKKVLDDQGASGAMISNIMGYGNQKGYKTKYRGSEYVVNLLPKIEEMIKALSEVLASEHVGAGKIFVYNVEDAVRVRTGERGEIAL